jgi:hypothetical protein
VSYIYVIAPVGSDPEYPIKRDIIERLSVEFALQFFFPLDHYQTFSIASARSDLRSAKLIIADLSLERPSCYFELGIAQGLDIPVQQIARADTPIHQTANRRDVRYYADLSEYEMLFRSFISIFKISNAA